MLKLEDYYAVAGLYASSADGETERSEIRRFSTALSKKRLKDILTYQNSHTFKEFLEEVNVFLKMMDVDVDTKEQIKIGILCSIADVCIVDGEVAEEEKEMLSEAENILDQKLNYKEYFYYVQTYRFLRDFSEQQIAKEQEGD